MKDYLKNLKIKCHRQSAESGHHAYANMDYLILDTAFNEHRFYCDPCIDRLKDCPTLQKFLILFKRQA